MFKKKEDEKPSTIDSTKSSEAKAIENAQSGATLNGDNFSPQNWAVILKCEELGVPKEISAKLIQRHFQNASLLNELR